MKEMAIQINLKRYELLNELCLFIWEKVEIGP